MKNEPQSHCHQCGTRYVRQQEENEWPKVCPLDAGGCGNLQWFNPKPIAVLIQPVIDSNRIGVLTPVRGLNPMRGYPALTGGFQEGHDRSSEDGAARELWEEIRNDRVNEDDIQLLCSRSTGPMIPEQRQNLVFGVARNPVPLSIFDGWEPDEETLSIEISWKPRVLAFPSHTYAMARYFQEYHGVKAPESYIMQPRTGDRIEKGKETQTVFNVPYLQPSLDKDIWHVELEDKNGPVLVRHNGNRWEFC